MNVSISFARIAVASVAGGVLLFLWSGLAQAVLPWGVPSAKVYISQSSTNTEAFKTAPGQVTTLEANQLTTPLFDEIMVNAVKYADN
jgi:hypothetical protein